MNKISATWATLFLLSSAPLPILAEGTSELELNYQHRPAVESGYPNYSNGLLTIPRVDTQEQPGQFQDARLQFDPQTGSWRLLDFKARTQKSFREFSTDNVELIMTDTPPIQVFLKIRTFTANGCETLGQVNQRLVGNRFEVSLSFFDPLENEPVACTQALVPFATVVPLQVYGLNAGTYEYSVNGDLIGLFTLVQDNLLQPIQKR